MARVLANENTPREAVLAARAAGFDTTWMVELQPGTVDEIRQKRGPAEKGSFCFFADEKQMSASARQKRGRGRKGVIPAEKGSAEKGSFCFFADEKQMSASACPFPEFPPSPRTASS